MRAFRLKRTNSATAAVNGWTMMLHRASQCSRSYFKMTEASYLLSPSPQTPQQRVTQAAATSWIPRSDVTARLGLNTPGLGSALTAQGFKILKPEPWAEL